MSKPVLFFSHSSRDEKVLRDLKHELLKKTGGTIDVFLSSDGQSIPLGRNWVSKVEQAMESSAIMFAFLSPNSVQSKWIYFEAGYSYSKKIRVIPVGILGFNLEDAGTPINLLQGFNIKNFDGLNNIIALINEEFDTSHPLSFTNNDFNRIFRQKQGEIDNPLVNYLPMIDRIEIEGHLEEVPMENKMRLQFFREKKEVIANFCKNKNILFQESDKGLHTYGLSIDFPQMNNIEFRIEPRFLESSLLLAEEIFLALGLEDPNPFVRIIFTKHVQNISEPYKITANFHNTEISLETNGYKWRNIKLNIEQKITFIQTGIQYSPPIIIMYPENIKLVSISFAELIDVLFTSGVLYLKELE